MNRTKQITRRILAMLLSLALLISVLPTFALGADTKDPLEKLDAKLVEALQNASAAELVLLNALQAQSARHNRL